MRGASSWREPPGRVVPVAASYLHAGNQFRKYGSSVKIDADQDIQCKNSAIGATIPTVRAAAPAVVSLPDCVHRTAAA